MSSSGSSIVSRINEPELMDVGYPRGFARAAAPKSKPLLLPLRRRYKRLKALGLKPGEFTHA
jgi:hypothetical protein